MWGFDKAKALDSTECDQSEDVSDMIGWATLYEANTVQHHLTMLDNVWSVWTDLKTTHGHVHRAIQSKLHDPNLYDHSASLRVGKKYVCEIYSRHL